MFPKSAECTLHPQGVPLHVTLDRDRNVVAPLAGARIIHRPWTSLLKLLTALKTSPIIAKGISTFVLKDVRCKSASPDMAIVDGYFETPWNIMVHCSLD